MRVTRQTKMEKRKSKFHLPLGFDSRVASRPGGFDLITLVDRLNSGLGWPKCATREAAKQERMAKRVRQEIIQEVSSVLEALRDPSGSPRPLMELVDKINTLGLKGDWTVLQAAPLRVSEDGVIPVGARVLRIGGKRWLVDSSFRYSANTLGPWSYRLVRQMFYQPLISALETGEFKRLRRCKWRECQKFFVAEDLRQEFCSDQCRNTFNNKKRLKEGWFTEQRQKKRKRVLALARRLLRESKPLKEIMKASRLSERILRKAGLIELGG